MAGGLTSDQIKALGRALAALRQSLQSQDEDSAEWRAPVELDQQSVGRLSRMDAMQQQSMMLAEKSRRQAELQRIERALQLMEEGEYGYCVTCGEEIGQGRLGLDPSILTCLKCASEVGA